MRWAVVVLIGCGRVGFEAGGDAGGGRADAPDSALAWSPFAAPQYIAPLSSSQTDWEPAVTPDGATIVFTRVSQSSAALYLATQQAGTWSAPVAIGAPLATTCSFGPAWAASGTHLYCSGTGTGMKQLYVATYDGTTFGTPALVAGLESVTAESPTIAADELELFYTGTTPLGASVLGRATRATIADPWTDLGVVPELATLPGDTGWPSLSSDGLTIFVETSPDASTTSIYTASRSSRAAPFGSLAPVAEVDATGQNGDPEISFDGTTLYFASTSLSGSTSNWDLFDAVRVRQ